MTHLKPRSTTVLLYQGDDMDQLAHLKRKLDYAERQAAQKAQDAKDGAALRYGDDLEEDTSVADAQREYDSFLDQAAERALEVELRAIGRRRFRDLLEAHPPRMVDSEPDEDGKIVKVEHEDDAGWGVDASTFPEALLCYRDDDVVTIAKPEFKNKGEVKAFIDDDLTDGDYEQMWVAALMLNRSPSADPFVHRSAGSPTTPTT